MSNIPGKNMEMIIIGENKNIKELYLIYIHKLYNIEFHKWNLIRTRQYIVHTMFYNIKIFGFQLYCLYFMEYRSV